MSHENRSRPGVTPIASRKPAVFVQALEDGIATVVLETPDARVNKINAQVMDALQEVLTGLEKNPPRKGVVFLSRRDHFCYGADVELVAAIKDREAALAGSLRGQEVYGRIAALPCPTVLAVRGVCLGGGLEWALACDRIVAASDPATRLGLPEVRLGILPGWGGTQRLAARVGLGAAVRIMATGRSLNPARARSLGLVDRLAPLDRLEGMSREMVQELSSRFPGRRPSRPRRGRLLRGLTRWLAPLRWWVFSRIRKMVAAQAGPHYPAPLAIVEAVMASSWLRRKKGFLKERELFADLVLSEVSRHLVGLFFLQRESKKWYSKPGETSAGGEIQTVAVLGAGVMGAGIALQVAAAGLEVILRDISDPALDTAMGRIRSSLKEKVGKHRLSQEDMEAQLRRIQPVTDLGPLAGADLVIEAVLEEMELKKSVLQEAALAAPGALLATNTSALSVGEMAAALEDPGRLAGLHFFNPVERMPLVEIILQDPSDRGLLTRLARFIRHLGKTPVSVRDRPGFLVNRVLSVYLGEAVQMVVEGHTILSVDGLMRRFGMPVGPLELLDQVGLDVAGKVVQTLRDAFPDRLSPVDLLERMLEKGRTGQKSGCGFYHHGTRDVPDQEGVAELAGLEMNHLHEAGDTDLPRLLYPLLAEAARCLSDQVVGGAAEIDLAMVMGIGWPPFRGGPLRHADEIGLGVLVSSLKDLAHRHGARFLPPAFMVEMARSGRQFHS